MEVAKKAGYKDTHTLRNQACKLRRECADEITDELHRNFGPKVQILPPPPYLWCNISLFQTKE